MATITRVPVQSIRLGRETKEKDAKGNPKSEILTPKVGEPFEFTQAEIDEIEEATPDALRKPIDESTKKVSKKQVQAAYDKVVKDVSASAAKKVLTDTTGKDKLADVDAEQYPDLVTALDAARAEPL